MFYHTKDVRAISTLYFGYLSSSFRLDGFIYQVSLILYPMFELCCQEWIVSAPPRLGRNAVLESQGYHIKTKFGQSNILLCLNVIALYLPSNCWL